MVRVVGGDYLRPDPAFRRVKGQKSKSPKPPTRADWENQMLMAS